MSAHCHHCHDANAAPPADGRFRRVLWIALVVNAALFVVEFAGSWSASSVSLLADAVDFAGDAANYALSLFVLSMAAAWRARTAIIKGATMALYGSGVLAVTVWNLSRGAVPEPIAMGVIGTLALAGNLFVAFLLYRYRAGDANMRSVWLCTRNDAIGNLAILCAAAGVFGTGTAWPDLAVAAIMATLAITAAVTVIRAARIELATAPHVSMAESHSP
ncbi:MAG: cation transporter [Betaproteobacteria bacterium]|nr:cation transporter [Betaproteobacteria bacterium]